jgi:hypothetical protein
MVTPETEQLLKLEELRRRIDAAARAFTLRLVFALALAFAFGCLVGRLWR